MEMNLTEQNYKVAERAENAIKQYGTIEKAIDYLKAELNGFENAWGSFSSDCLRGSEQLKCHHQYMNAGTLQGDAMKKCLKCGDYVKTL